MYNLVERVVEAPRQTKQNHYFVGLGPDALDNQKGRRALVFKSIQRNKMTEVLLR
jgi:hypothetical protein